ncbi:MAG: aminotransferase V [Candidatus Aminicenantes bacterium RBG_19FT_COMBO_58_17]|nr:MAG: aminotransferase V [Candidatus Aminicenantes bacterium RBG_19FT_COMBO_58_17]HCS46768.1 aminotransferase [Candidatus Aminicenantes bacterium]
MREKLLLIPGPSPVHPRIIHSLAQPTVSHVGPEMVEELPKALDNLKKIVFCEKGEAFIIAGAGTLAMEMALLNTLASGEKALIISQGYFGSRMAEICGSFGLDYDILESTWGRAVLPEELSKRLADGDYRIVVATHVDTATGACAPVRDYAEVLKRRDLLFIVDGVCATGGIEERMDDWGIDVVFTAAQKCFGVPPGLAVLVLSERAMGKRIRMERIPAYYSDLLRWLPIMKDPAKYFSTPCVNEIRAFYESTLIVLEEGLEPRFGRHIRTARALRSGLETLGFTFFTQKEFLAATLSVFKYPPGVEDKRFRSLYYENGVVVAGGLGETAGKVFRMGHMGNLSLSQVYFALDALEQTLKTIGYAFEMGSGRRAAKAILGE